MNIKYSPKTFEHISRFYANAKSFISLIYANAEDPNFFLST